MRIPKESTLKKLAVGQSLVLITLGFTLIFIQGCMHYKTGTNETTMSNSNSLQAESAVDGEIVVPENYRDWPKLMETVDKEKAGQVRDIYINPAGINTGEDDAFPFGTQTVMEIYSARMTLSGEPAKDANGRMIKDGLSRIFVMEKGKGWGAQQPEGVTENGDWVYGAYMMDRKTPATKDFSACRTCHLPLAKNDYIAR